MSSLKTIIIEKGGSLKELTIKQFHEEELYKKAGFKIANHFKLHHTYHIVINSNTTIDILLYGKTNGKAGQENKYDFPPPIDKLLFFGSCLLIKKQNDVMTNLTIVEWNMLYEKLFGGFENLKDTRKEDEEDENKEEDEEDLKILIDIQKKNEKQPLQFTEEGYVLDDFIVNDDIETVKPVKPTKKIPRVRVQKKNIKKAQDDNKLAENAKPEEDIKPEIIKQEQQQEFIEKPAKKTKIATNVEKPLKKRGKSKEANVTEDLVTSTTPLTSTKQDKPKRKQKSKKETPENVFNITTTTNLTNNNYLNCENELKEEEYL